MTTAPYDESVREAVAREAARRKRVFLAFLGLLLIPIAIGAWALSKAPTEIEKVATDVTPLVTSRVSGEISERVTKDVSAKTEPLIRENVAREITAAVEPRLSSVAKDLTQLQTSVQKTSELVQSVTPQLDAARALNNRLSVSLQAVNANTQALTALNRQVAEMNRELKDLQRRVKELDNPWPRPVPIPR